MSTGAVKSRDRLTRTVVWTGVGLLWAAAELTLWLLAKNPMAYSTALRGSSLLFRVLLLPAAAAVATAALGGLRRERRRLLWLLPALFAVLFALVPSVTVIDNPGLGTLVSFCWPDLFYIPVGALSSLAGLGLMRLTAILRRSERRGLPER